MAYRPVLPGATVVSAAPPGVVTQIRALSPDTVAKAMLRKDKSGRSKAFSGDEGEDNHINFAKFVRNMIMEVKHMSVHLVNVLDVLRHLPEGEEAPELYREANEFVYACLYKCLEGSALGYVNDLFEANDGQRALLTLKFHYLGSGLIDASELKSRIAKTTETIKGRADPGPILRALYEDGKRLHAIHGYAEGNMVGDALSALDFESYKDLKHDLDGYEERTGAQPALSYVTTRIHAHHRKYLKGKDKPGLKAAAFEDPESPMVAAIAAIERRMKAQDSKLSDAIAVLTRSQTGGGGGKGGKGGTKGGGAGKGKGGKDQPAKFPCRICKNAGLGENEIHYASDCPIVQAGRNAMNITISSTNAAPLTEEPSDEDDIQCAVRMLPPVGVMRGYTQCLVFLLHLILLPWIALAKFWRFSEYSSESQSAVPPDYHLKHPQSYKEAVTQPSWEMAMEEEMKILNKMTTLSDEDVPELVSDSSSDSDSDIPELVTESNSSDSDEGCETEDALALPCVAVEPMTIGSNWEGVSRWKFSLLVAGVVAAVLAVTRGTLVILPMATCFTSPCQDTSRTWIPAMEWMVDSGAGQSLCREKDWFRDLDTNAPVKRFRVAHADELLSKGVGTVVFPPVDNRTGEVRFRSEEHTSELQSR